MLPLFEFECVSLHVRLDSMVNKYFTATIAVGREAIRPDNAMNFNGNLSVGFYLNLLKTLFEYS